MKKFILLNLLICCTVSGIAQDYGLYEKHVYERCGQSLPYRLLRPAGNDGPYPLVIFLHGMGKRGKDNERQLDLGADVFLESGTRRDFPCYVLYPQTDGRFIEVVQDGRATSLPPRRAFDFSKDPDPEVYIDLSMHGKMVIGLVDSLMANLGIDSRRVYLAGTSMGASSAYCMIAKYPDLFAAAVLMGGTCDIRSVDIWKDKVPVWIIHGMKDTISPPETDMKVVDVLHENCVDCRYDFYPDSGHDCWTKTFGREDFIEWIFSNSK